jgi:exo-beta-1,3-glucanase (GH17 family)
MCYSPYQGNSASDSSCKSSEQVMSDISEIAAKGFKAVRIYATDCAQLENVGAAAKQYGLKMIIGIYIDSSGISSDAYSQLSDITSYFAGDYSLVEMALIGNEALFNGYVSAGELASFISDCKSTLKGAGYSGPVTTADTVASILANESELCGSIDALAANIHPFFNGNVQPEGACAFVEQQMQMLGAACGGSLPVYNSETGWPSQGPNYMNAVPGTAEQQAAIESLATCSCSDKNSYLSFENDMWKDDGTDSVEPYWGCVQLFS